MTAVTQAVPSAVAPSVDTSLAINKVPQRLPYKPMDGSPILPVVPRTERDGEVTPQRKWGGMTDSGSVIDTGGGAPSVAIDGFLFKRQPIDSHYTSEYQAYNPYAKVNNPPTRGMFTFVKEFLNGIGLGVQNRESTGWNNRAPQQRTSVMRVTPPALGIGFAPEIFTPKQMPQQPNTAKYLPATGTDRYGTRRGDRYSTGVLNSDTLGAGQTAGGIGGNNYTPAPGPPDTNSITAGGNPSNMPTWG